MVPAAGFARALKLVEGAPLETSYGADLYRNIFGEAEATLIKPRLEALTVSPSET